jgi:hypothetical protein
MGRKRATESDGGKLEGLKYFALLDDLFERLRPYATERDKAGNRKLFYDRYALLLLLYYFNPTAVGLRSIRQFTTVAKVQKKFGVRATSLGSLSEAARVFDAEALEPIVAELAARAQTRPGALPSAKEAALAGLIAVDGTLLRALPKMLWAVWQDAEHRAAKLHVAFGVFAGAPLQASLTAGNGSERDEWRKFAQPGGLYVCDRGYADYSLFRELDADDVRFVVRLQENAVYEVEGENELTADDRGAGVVRDVTLRRLGTEKHNPLLERPLRIVEVAGTEPGQVWILATNAHGLTAELVAIAYRHRWSVELFFRWLKCVLGCKHLVSENANGVAIQVYLAVIASLLIALWTGRKPTRRTYEMLCYYFQGWATLDELQRHLQSQTPKPNPPD